MKTAFLICLLVLLVLLGYGYRLEGVLPKEIMVGYHEDFPPYVKDVKGNVSGIFPDMINEAAKIMKIRVKYKKYPWKRMVKNAKQGEVDAIIPLFKTKEREEFLCFPGNGIAVGESFFFTRDDSGIEYNGDLHELKPYPIGIVEGYWYGEEFDRANYLQKNNSSSDEALVEMLLSRRFQVGAGPESVIRYYAEKMKASSQIKILQPAFMRGILYVGFSRSKEYCKELAHAFSAAVQELDKNGTHQKILNDHGRVEDMAFFKEIIIGGDEEDYRPYCYWEEKKEKKEKKAACPIMKGACADIIQSAAEHIGVKVCYKPVKWNKFPTLIKKGEINAIMPLFKRKEREEYLYFQGDGLVSEKNIFFTLKSKKLDYSGAIKKLKRYTVGVLKNYQYGKDFDNLEGITKKEYDSIKELVAKIQGNEVQIGIGSEHVIRYFAEQAGILNKIEFLHPSLPAEPLYLAFTKTKGTGYEKLAMGFADAIRVLKIRGEYEKILGYHGLETRKLRLGADNWPPYYSEGLENNGPLAEIIRAAFQRMGYDVDFDFMPWANLLDKVKKGELDGGFAATPAPLREQDYYFSEVIIESSPLVVYYKSDAGIVYTGPHDLENYRVGMVRGDMYSPAIYGIKGKQVFVANSAEANFRNLLDERLDVVIVDELQGQYLRKTIFPDKANRFEKFDLYPKDKAKKIKQAMHLFISKKSAKAGQVRNDFNYGLKKIKEDGTVERILKNHGVNDVAIIH